MPSHKKSKMGSGKVKDLKSRKLSAGKAENVKGGGGEFLLQQPLEPMPSFESTLSNMMKKSSDTTSAIISNLK